MLQAGSLGCDTAGDAECCSSLAQSVQCKATSLCTSRQGCAHRGALDVAGVALARLEVEVCQALAALGLVQQSQQPAAHSACLGVSCWQRVTSSSRLGTLSMAV